MTARWVKRLCDKLSIIYYNYSKSDVISEAAEGKRLNFETVDTVEVSGRFRLLHVIWSDIKALRKVDTSPEVFTKSQFLAWL